MAQAGVLCHALNEQVRALTTRLAKVEPGTYRRTSRGLACRREAAGLRRDIAKAQFLLEGLYRRFPEIIPVDVSA